MQIAAAYSLYKSLSLITVTSESFYLPKEVIYAGTRKIFLPVPMTDNLKLRCREPSANFMIGSDLIIGCSSFAGLYLSSTDEIVEATVKSALDAGFIKFDTAPHYGCGLGEERLGKAMTKIFAGGKSNHLKIWTKAGRLMIPYDEVNSSLESIAAEHSIDYSNVPGSSNCLFPDTPKNIIPVFDYSSMGITKSHADSLRRMEMRSIHGLRLHDCESPPSIKEALAGGLGALIKMRADSVISEVSLGVNDANAALSILCQAPLGSFDSIMVAGCWNLLEHPLSSLDLFLECQRRSVVVHNAGIFASGLLAGGTTYRYHQATAEQIERTERWTQLCDEYSVPLPAVAIKFALLFTVIEATAVGVKNADEVRQLVDWFNIDVPQSLFREAKVRGLLCDHVPLYEPSA